MLILFMFQIIITHTERLPRVVVLSPKEQTNKNTEIIYHNLKIIIIMNSQVIWITYNSY